MPPRPSVNLVGHLHSTGVTGRTARALVAALDAESVPLRPLALPDPAGADDVPFAVADGLANPFPVNLLCVDPRALPAVARDLGPDFFAGRHTVAWWSGPAPAAWPGELGFLDEVWAPDAALAGVAPVAVAVFGDPASSGRAIVERLTALVAADPGAPPTPPAASHGLLDRAALRVGRPLLSAAQASDAAREAAAAADRLARAAEEAAILRATRRVESRLADLENRLADLREFAVRADAAIHELTHAAYAPPFLEGAPFALRDEPGAGRVLGYRGAEDRDGAYHAFEEVFRGSEDMIRERQRVYVPLLAARAPVLDAGCGRGEMLDLLRDAGVEVIGIDADPTLVAHCRGKGHTRVEEGDAVAWLEAAAPGSLGAVFSAQVAEHLPHDVLDRLLAAARRVLRPGGVCVIETVNPHSPSALKAFWVDLTHEQPIFPEVLLQHCRAAGFPSGYVFAPNGAGDWEADRRTAGEYAVVATV